MRTYFKILLITAGIQIAGYVITYRVDDLLMPTGKSTVVPFYIGAFFLVCSLLAGIILPIRWCKTIRKRILTIFLMPTNYTWLVIVIMVIVFVSRSLDALTNLPINFG